MKRGDVLSFVDGVLTIKVSGYGNANGWGEFAFHERQVEIDADGYHKIEIPPSELRELRDFITRVLDGASRCCQGLAPKSECRCEQERLTSAVPSPNRQGEA